MHIDNYLPQFNIYENEYLCCHRLHKHTKIVISNNTGCLIVIARNAMNVGTSLTHFVGDTIVVSAAKYSAADVAIKKCQEKSWGTQVCQVTPQLANTVKDLCQ